MFFLFFFMTLGTFFPALEIFEVRRPELHLCEFYGVLVALPVEPVDPLQGGGKKKKKGWKSRREAHGTYCTMHQRKHSFHDTQPRGICVSKYFSRTVRGEKPKTIENARKPSRREERDKSRTLL